MMMMMMMMMIPTMSGNKIAAPAGVVVRIHQLVGTHIVDNFSVPKS